MKKLSVCYILVLCMLFPVMAWSEVSQNVRLLQKPEWDGAVMQTPWLGGDLRYQNYDADGTEWKDYTIGPTFITSLPQLRKLELGGRFRFISWDPDKINGFEVDSKSGLSDIDMWGKYQFITKPLYLSGGLLLTLPTGDDEVAHPWASGEVNFELFCAGRYNASRQLAVVGHFGLRINSDADLEGKLKNGQKFKAELDGETQFELGGGVIYAASNQLNILGEFNIATEAYDDSENDIELTGGVEYAFSRQFSFRSGLGLGLADGAPQWELILGCGYTF